MSQVFALELSGPPEPPAPARPPAAVPPVAVVTPAPRDDWRDLLAADAGAAPEHEPAWTDALCATGRYADASRLYTVPDGRRFVLPLLRRTGLPGLGGALESYPAAWGMGGLVGPHQDVDVVRAVVADLRGTGSQRLRIFPDPLRSAAWSTAVGEDALAVPRRAHVLDLTGGPDAVWARMHGSGRRGVRTAERRGVEVVVDRHGDLLADYHRLYLLSVDRWAVHQHEPRLLARARAQRRDPLSKLRLMAAALGPAMVVTMAYVGGRAAAGSVTLLGRTAHYVLGAMDLAVAGPSRASYLVQWTNLQLSCEAGCSVYHLGESGRSPSLAQYKESLGGVPVDYAELRLERLPYTRLDQAARGAVKRVLGFRDV